MGQLVRGSGERQRLARVQHTRVPLRTPRHPDRDVGGGDLGASVLAPARPHAGGRSGRRGRRLMARRLPLIAIVVVAIVALVIVDESTSQSPPEDTVAAKALMPIASPPDAVSPSF